MRFTLRDYQQEAIQSAMQARREGFRRLLICLPTGAGKTVIFSELCRIATQNVLVLAHREELLQQARSKIAQMTENKIKISIEQGDMHSSSDAKVVVASIRSLRSDRLQALQKRHNFGLIIYDECHHAAADDNKRVLEELGAFDPDWTGTLIGFTATTKRADGIGLEKVFKAIVYWSTFVVIGSTPPLNCTIYLEMMKPWRKKLISNHVMPSSLVLFKN